MQARLAAVSCPIALGRGARAHRRAVVPRLTITQSFRLSQIAIGGTIGTDIDFANL